jgi:hypothetical protein
MMRKDIGNTHKWNNQLWTFCIMWDHKNQPTAVALVGVADHWCCPDSEHKKFAEMWANSDIDIPFEDFMNKILGR